MKLKNINDCGTATVELHYDEMLFIAEIMRESDRLYATNGGVLLTWTLCELRRLAGVMTQLCVDEVDSAKACEKANAMLTAEPLESVKEYEAKTKDEGE